MINYKGDLDTTTAMGQQALTNRTGTTLGDFQSNFATKQHGAAKTGTSSTELSRVDWKLNENVLRGFTITIILKRDVAEEKRE